MGITSYPLWIDVSEHQGKINWDAVKEYGVVGACIRAGCGLNKDPLFQFNYNEAGRIGIWRTSYWAIWPELDFQTQMTRWVEQHPVLDVIPRVVDFEHIAGSVRTFLLDTLDYFEQDEPIPWLYTRANLMDVYLDGWDFDGMFFALAEYNLYRNKEEEGLVLPDGVDIDQVLMKQTADQISVPSITTANTLDHNRWIRHGNVADMNKWIITKYRGGDITNPDCQQFEERLSTVENDIKQAWADWRATHTGLVDNILDIKELRVEFATVRNGVLDNADKLDSLQSLTNTCSLGIAELAKRIENLMQGQMELAENGLGYEDSFKEIAVSLTDLDKRQSLTEETIVGDNGVYERIEALEEKLEVLLDNKENLHDKIYKLEDVLATHSHVEPVDGTFGERLRWLFTGRTTSKGD